MTLLTRSQTKAMDRKAGESLLAYEERLAVFIQEANDRAAAAAKERHRLEQEEEAKRQKEEQDRLRQEEADLQAAAEHRSRQRERLFTRETVIGDEAVHWQEEILHLQQTVDQMFAWLQALEKQPAVVAAAGPSNLATRVQVLEDDVSNIKREHQDFRTSKQATNLQLEMQVQAAATVTPAAASSRRPPKLDDIPVFCDQSKTESIPWWRQLTLRLDMHHVPNNDRHPCLYHRSGGACQAWLGNILTSHDVAVSKLHTKLTWQELTDAWHKRFQVEPTDLQAMDKLNKLHHNTLLSQDRITEFQRLTSTPNLPLAFHAIKHLFIMRSCPALQNALTQIAETLDTSDKLFSTASRIILTNIEARNVGRSSAMTSGTQPKPKVTCITSTEAATPNEGEVLAAARDGGRPRNNHGRDKTNTQSTSTPSTGSAADEPWAQYGLSANFYRTRLKYRYCLWCNSTIRCCTLPHQGETPSGKVGAAEGDSTPPSTPPEAVVATTALSSEAYVDVGSLPLSYEDFAARLVPSLDASQGQDTCAAFSPPEGSSASSSSSRDSASVFNEEALDPLTPEDFAWVPLPTTGNLSGPQSAALCALLHKYLSFHAPPTSPTVDEVAVGDMLGYVAKVAREFVSQRYEENNAPLLYVRIQIGQAACNALLDCGATRNFISQSFMTRAGLGAQLRRKSHPTTVALADGKTKQLLDRYISAVPVYFAPHACEPVTFDVLDTDFDVILGMPWLSSADHTVNFHRRTLTIRDATGAEVPCTIPPPRSSIRCQVVSAKSFRDTCHSEHVEEIGITFLRTVPTTDSSSTDVSSDPRVTRLLDEFSDVFETPSGIVPDWPISHEIILEAAVVPPKGCIYRMSEEELTAAMTIEFRAMVDRFVLVYLDDILVYSRTLEEHLEHIRRVLDTLRLARYKAYRDKCEFVRQELEYLGHFVSPEGIRPLADKIQAIQEWPEPKNVTDVQSFLGLAAYYQRFIKSYSKIVANLSKLQSEERPFDFDNDAELAYNSSIHPAIGMSPFEFEHGSPISSPLDATLPRTAESDDHLAFLRRMQELLVKARDQMSKTQIRMSRQANRNRLPCPFRAGDLVWVSAAEFSLEQDISRKLLPKWMGPWRIISAVGDDPEGPSFRIAVPPHLPVHTVFHCSKLAPFVSAESDEFPGRRMQDPPSMDGFQEAGYIITDRRHGNKETEFHLHFSYCSHKADRWLTRSELQATAPAVLSRYLSKGKTTPSTPSPRLPRYIPPMDRQLRPRPGSSS
ncbi:hypothetical protein CBR_g52601 [Chara braunii]|uniref:Uncharacterized protein n=1 Tax=Chara braunii TaxID=69332 RepID=A0A388MAH0_CHABU|nr:hypothetical protein CBR_g52601 [Chara braunii]|eukprot:GBG91567.1 hypothetical protein CBR_g52601 [Chara braunii]